ncbi:MAG: DUF4431 domain-containing protein [Oligoflexia bacterium]|nr:DUF4431 domain-containing protein [Oligoflexia bacterium]
MAFDYEKPYKKFIVKNNKIKVRGQLFKRLTGHHHARILMDVDNVEKLELRSQRRGK